MASSTSRYRNPGEKHSESASNGKALGVLFKHKALVEKYLLELYFSEDPRLDGLTEAMRYSFLVGGKRIRATLCMEVAGSFGGEPAKVLPAAAAIEFIHTMSLIHDDLPAMDDDEFRRGAPTTHKKFGEATAILAGDAFFGESLALITLRQEGTPEQILEVVRELAVATGVNGMVGGQILDMRHTGGGIDSDTLDLMHGYKTGSLIKASARIGAILAGATAAEQAAVSEYARHLGLCFQIVDDILDATGTDKDLGKRAGSDAGHGKATFAEVYGIEGARQQADNALERAATALDSLDADTAELYGLARFVRSRTY